MKSRHGYAQPDKFVGKAAGLLLPSSGMAVFKQNANNAQHKSSPPNRQRVAAPCLNFASFACSHMWLLAVLACAVACQEDVLQVGKMRAEMKASGTWPCFRPCLRGSLASQECDPTSRSEGAPKQLTRT
eukprot:4421312-Amphidinium_carterae.1